MKKAAHVPASEPFVLRRQIGSTTFLVGIHFDANANESLDEKVKRLLKNDLQSNPLSATINAVASGLTAERSSL